MFTTAGASGNLQSRISVPQDSSPESYDFGRRLGELKGAKMAIA
jgi:hypothetical protein